MPVSTSIEDELHPRVQVREYARHLQSAYGGLLENALPERLTALLGGIEKQTAARPERDAEERG
jgi:hypothetical protein